MPKHLFDYHLIKPYVTAIKEAIEWDQDSKPEIFSKFKEARVILSIYGGNPGINGGRIGEAGEKRRDLEGSVTAGTMDAPQPGETAGDSLAVESAQLHAQGLSEEVIAMLLGARKTTTNTTYSRIWRRFVNFALQHNFSLLTPGIANILEFLQTAVTIGLAYNSIKVQVSVLLHRTWMD